MKKRLLELSEAIAIIKIILLLTIIFGFNDGRERFVFNSWFTNLFLVFLIVSLVVLFNVLGLKLSAKYYGTEIKMKTWNSQKFKDANSLTKKLSLIYSTPILNIIVTLFSNGRIYLANVLSFNYKKEVLGRKFQYLTYFNIAVIVFFGLLFNLILMWIFKIFSFDLGLKISFWFILFNLVPISELYGAKIMSGSVTFYIFCLIFFLLNIILLQFVNSFSALFVSLLFSVVLSTLYFFVFQYKKA